MAGPFVYGRCQECGCRLLEPAKHVEPDGNEPICVTCYAVLESIATSQWLQHCHHEWKKEQAYKKRLLEGH